MRNPSPLCCDKTMDGKLALYCKCYFANWTKLWWKNRCNHYPGSTSVPTTEILAAPASVTTAFDSLSLPWKNSSRKWEKHKNAALLPAMFPQRLATAQYHHTFAQWNLILTHLLSSKTLEKYKTWISYFNKMWTCLHFDKILCLFTKFDNFFRTLLTLSWNIHDP